LINRAYAQAQQFIMAAAAEESLIEKSRRTGRAGAGGIFPGWLVDQHPLVELNVPQDGTRLSHPGSGRR